MIHTLLKISTSETMLDPIRRNRCHKLRRKRDKKYATVVHVFSYWLRKITSTVDIVGICLHYLGTVHSPSDIFQINLSFKIYHAINLSESYQKVDRPALEHIILISHFYTLKILSPAGFESYLISKLTLLTTTLT